MKIATWNVNSIRARLGHLLDWLASESPDAVALQETKVPDQKFPTEEISGAGYRAVFAGEKSYNGVAILAREEPTDVVRELPGTEGGQKRFLVATVGPVRVASVYVPNGQAVGSPQYGYKLDWLARLEVFCRSANGSRPLVLGGDFNVAPDERDVHDPEAWAGKILFSDPERAAFRRLLDAGFVDVFRHFEQPPGEFSWWDYRMGAFRKNLGLRIDHLLLTAPFAAACRSCRVDREPRRRERPSDHAPVVMEIDLE